MMNWATIVYGRTSEVDFRLLALPRDFTRSEEDWLMAHIQTMTRYPEDLPNKPRWAVVRQDELCVLVVACMARELMEQAQTDGMELTHDHRGRPLYTVVGYATRLSQGEPVQIPAYLDQDLRVFSSTYQEYVTPHWLVKSYVQDSVTASEYQPLSAAPAIVPAQLDQSYFVLNLTQPNLVVLWPDNIDERQALWATAAQQLASGENVSLCLCFPTQSSAVNGAFLNGTAVGIAQKEQIIRIPESTSTSDSTDVEQPTITDQSVVSSILSWIVARILLVGSL
ncbi:MAG: hypothetical protein F6K31_36290 [Symploca sp. SIO2G7]|nr:hypothetical protein [Symploca sp. SIO2G7]